MIELPPTEDTFVRLAGALAELGATRLEGPEGPLHARQTDLPASLAQWSLAAQRDGIAREVSASSLGVTIVMKPGVVLWRSERDAHRERFARALG